MTLSFREYGDKLQRYINGLPQEYDLALFKGATVLNADINSRIFADAKAVDGGAIGNYTSPAYKKLRRNDGLQIGTVDLIFKGDLQRSLKLGKSKLDYKIQIQGDLNVTKARVNEERFQGKDGVFAASKEERIKAINTIDKNMDNYVKRIFN